MINGYSVHDSAVAIHALHGALLAGQFETSLNLCLGFAAAQPQDKTAVYLHLILPTISRLGDDWNADRASFEQIAFAYGLMQQILDTLGRTEGTSSCGPHSLFLGRVIIAVAPEDTHDFGARIMAESLRLQGWHATMIDGFNSAKITPLLQQEQVNALALSVSTDTAFMGLADMITEWRYSDCTKNIEIFVGGSAIIQPYEQYGFLQADRVGLRIEELSRHLSEQVTNGRYGTRILT